MTSPRQRTSNRNEHGSTPSSSTTSTSSPGPSGRWKRRSRAPASARSRRRRRAHALATIARCPTREAIGSPAKCPSKQRLSGLTSNRKTRSPSDGCAVIGRRPADANAVGSDQRITEPASAPPRSTRPRQQPRLHGRRHQLGGLRLHPVAGGRNGHQGVVGRDPVPGVLEPVLVDGGVLRRGTAARAWGDSADRRRRRPPGRSWRGSS